MLISVTPRRGTLSFGNPHAVRVRGLGFRVFCVSGLVFGLHQVQGLDSTLGL